FAGSPFTYGAIPVTLAPGRRSLSIKPSEIGSASTGTTIGIVEVAFLAASACIVADATMRCGLSSTNSAATVGNRSIWPSAPRFHYVEIAAFDVTKFSHSFQKLLEICFARLHVVRSPPQQSNERSLSGPLGHYALRPYGRAAEQRDEVATVHSITSSARASSIGGSSRPSIFAVLRLMTNSILMGACTGK